MALRRMAVYTLQKVKLSESDHGENRKPQEDGLLRKTLFNLTMSQTGKKSSSDGETTPQAPLVNESIRGSKSRFPKAGSRKESIDPKTTDSQPQDKTLKTISLDAENRKPQEDGLLRKTLFNLTMSQTGKKSSSDGETTPQAPLVNESIRGSKSRFPKAGSRKESIDPKTTDSQPQDKTLKTISLDAAKTLTSETELGFRMEEDERFLQKLGRKADSKCLDLNNCRQTTADVRDTGEAIKVLPELEELNLSWNSKVGGNLPLILQTLQQGSKIQTLELMDCTLTSEDGVFVGQLLPRLQNPEVLDLSINRNIGGSLNSIAHGLKSTSNLKVLKLHSCGLSQKSVKLLASVIQTGHLARLQKLDLSYNDSICEAGWTIFCQNLWLLKELTELDISLRPSTFRKFGQWFRHLISAMTKLPKITEVATKRWLLPASQEEELQGFDQDHRSSIHFDHGGFQEADFPRLN
uniref:Leucine rich repeat containing 31 n=1 Tax=Bos mutus grunniens TaxID=30521 RepID=A0A8C0A7I1_BOSMU